MVVGSRKGNPDKLAGSACPGLSDHQLSIFSSFLLHPSPILRHTLNTLSQISRCLSATHAVLGICFEATCKEEEEKKNHYLLRLACALALLLFLSVSDLLPCFASLFLSAFLLFNLVLYVLFFTRSFFLFSLSFTALFSPYFIVLPCYQHRPQSHAFGRP